VNMLYPYGFYVHLRRPETPACMLRGKASAMPLRFSNIVEDYTRTLMSKLGLTPYRFVAAQYRMGFEWKRHLERKGRALWACYGMESINATLRRHLAEQEAAAFPIYLLTNDAFLHTPRQHSPGVPAPVTVLAETRIVSLAHTVLLNPMSSFWHTIDRLVAADKIRKPYGPSVTRVLTMRKSEVNDTCEICGSINEVPIRRHCERSRWRALMMQMHFNGTRNLRTSRKVMVPADSNRDAWKSKTRAALLAMKSVKMLEPSDDEIAWQHTEPATPTAEP
jgi:hypothetical protein